MGKGYQTINYPLPSQTFAAGGQSVVRMRDLPLQLYGRITHLAALHLEVTLTPAYTTAPTVVGHNALFNRLEFFDGQQVRFSGDGNALRQFERLENGGNRVMEALTNVGTGNPRYFSRTLYLGPPNFAGAPTDFVMPVCALENGELRIKWGALTDLSADCTAATATVRVTAVLVLLDEIRVPPFYERQVYTLGSNDSPIAGRGLYAFVAACNSSSYDAFAAADLANVTIDTGLGQAVPGTDARVLAKLYNQQYGKGSLDGIAGDPNNATYDVNDRIVNLGTPTAFAAQALDLAPLLWCVPGQYLSKIQAQVESSMRLRWSGSNGAGTIALVGRFLAQPPGAVGSIAERARRALGASGGRIKIKTLSKEDYSGPFVEFMPWALKVAR